MSLAGGDLTTPQNVATWLPAPPTLPSTIISQLVTRMSALIQGKLNRARIYSQTFARVFDGVGNMQLVLPDYPVTAVLSVQVGQAIVPASVLPAPGATQPMGTNPGYGWRCPFWAGNLPGENATLEFRGGYFPMGAQNVKVTYTAGYLVSAEPGIVPATPFQITTLQQQGIQSRDAGVVYAETGVALTPVAAAPTVGQYIPPIDSAPGVYTFSAADEGAALLISYSFVPSALEEACIQMVAERMGYRQRVGVVSQSLGGQETVRFMRGGGGGPYTLAGLPPEVIDMISDYINVVPPLIGAPV